MLRFACVVDEESIEPFLSAYCNDPSRQFDCVSQQGPDWQLLPEAPADLDDFLEIVKAAAQKSIEEGSYIGVPTQTSLESIRGPLVEWFESDDGSRIACIPNRDHPTESLSIYNFPRQNGGWATPFVFNLASLCGQ